MKKFCCVLLAMLLVFGLAGCGNPDELLGDLLQGYPVNGYAEGGLGDTLHSAFFDYTVAEAYTCGEYAGHLPYEGYQFLVVSITVKNTFGEAIPMFDTDFTVEWGTGEDDYDYPLSAYTGELMSEEELPSEYELADGQSVTGLLIYEVPVGLQDFSISYLEIYEDDSTGDSFSVKFTAENRGGPTGDVSGETGVYPTDGYAEGGLGDTMCTAFFEYTVNDAYTCGEYAGCTATEGYQFLVVSLTVKNTFGETIPMFDTDFTVEWGTGEEDCDYPLSSYTGELMSEEELPTEYELTDGESVTGLLIYEVPADLQNLAISYAELYEDGAEGDSFAVLFTASAQP